MDIRSITDRETDNKKIVIKKARRGVSIAIVTAALIPVSQMLLSLIIVFASYFLGKELSENSTTLLLIDMLVYILGGLIPLCVGSFAFKRLVSKVPHTLPKRNYPKKPLLFISGAIGVGFLTNILINVSFPKFAEKFSSGIQITAKTPAEVVLTFMLYALFPAILEEAVFRGLILKNLLPFGKFGAIFISSLLFGIVHIDPTRIIFATIFAFILGLCYEYTGSIAFPVLIHFINNFISVSASLLIDSVIANIVISVLIFSFAVCGVIALIFYFNNGIEKYKLSLKKPTTIGYRLPFLKFSSLFFINFATIPLFIIYFYFFYLHFGL